MIQTLLPPQMPLIHYLHDSNCHTQQKDDQGMQQIQSDFRVIRFDIVNKIEQSMQVKPNLTSLYGYNTLIWKRVSLSGNRTQIKEKFFLEDKVWKRV